MDGMRAVNSEAAGLVTTRRALLASLVGIAGIAALKLRPATATKPGMQVVADPAERYADAIEWLVKHDLFDPAREGTFLPGADVTREDAAIMLYRLAGAPERDGLDLEPYRDVEKTARSYREIMWMRGQAVFFGEYDATFQPTQPVTRAEGCSFLARLLRGVLAAHLAAGGSAVAPEIASFRDVSKEHPRFADIEWARAVGLLGRDLTLGEAESSGERQADASAPLVDAELRPDATLMRGEFARLLQRANALFDDAH